MGMSYRRLRFRQAVYRHIQMKTGKRIRDIARLPLLDFLRRPTGHRQYKQAFRAPRSAFTAVILGSQSSPHNTPSDDIVDAAARVGFIYRHKLRIWQA